MKKLLLSAAALMIAVTSLSLWMTKDGMVGQSPGALSPSAGTAAIGGAFELTDKDGKTVKESDFRGRVMLVFFGFTHCPDICPVTVKNLSDTMGLLADKADQVAPVFISVDPERDTPDVLKSYFANFDQRIVALTGSKEQTAQAASAYKAYYAKAEPKAEEAGGHADHSAHGAGGEYMVNHSGYVYLMDREGKYVQHFPFDAKPEAFAEALAPLLK